MKIWKIIFYILGLIPWTFIISLITFYFHAGQVLGRLPSYNQPDPKELSIYQYYSPFVDWTVKVWLISLMVWILLLIIYLIVKRKKIELKPLLISRLGNFIGILLLFSGIFFW